jgi:hypothetical protein
VNLSDEQIKKTVENFNDYTIELNKNYKKEFKIYLKPQLIANCISKLFGDSDEI